VPLAAVLGIHAVLIEESTELEWRWREMGSDEKVYTGRSRPIRRLAWRLNLADGSSLAGEIKGQPLWIERDGKRALLVLHARGAGEYGQTLADLVYPKDVVISRRAMQQAVKTLAQPEPTTRP
jgi:hypothetical protein